MAACRPPSRVIARLVARRERGRSRAAGTPAWAACRARCRGPAGAGSCGSTPPRSRLLARGPSYVEGRACPSRLRPFHRVLGCYLGRYYGPNDGMVAAGDQRWRGWARARGSWRQVMPNLPRRFPAACAGRRGSELCRCRASSWPPAGRRSGAARRGPATADRRPGAYHNVHTRALTIRIASTSRTRVRPPPVGGEETIRPQAAGACGSPWASRETCASYRTSRMILM